MMKNRKYFGCLMNLEKLQILFNGGRIKHLIEAGTQVFAGTVLIFVSNLIFFPLLGIEATTSANVTLVAINTVVAFLKSYFVRAFFRKTWQ